MEDQIQKTDIDPSVWLAFLRLCGGIPAYKFQCLTYSASRRDKCKYIALNELQNTGLY